MCPWSVDVLDVQEVEHFVYQPKCDGKFQILFPGFPNYILNPDQLDDKYKDLDIRQYEYFENNLRVNQYNLRRNVEKLDQPVNKTRYNFNLISRDYYCIYQTGTQNILR
jgi:predicted metalloendopeptidase